MPSSFDPPPEIFSAQLKISPDATDLSANRATQLHHSIIRAM